MWDMLPYKLDKNGKLVFDSNFKHIIKRELKNQKSKLHSPWDQAEDVTVFDPVTEFKSKFGYKPLSTDDVVNLSKNNGYNSTRFYNIADGPGLTESGRIVTKPINELILHNNTPAYVGNNLVDVAKQLNWSPTLFNYVSVLGGLNGSFKNENLK